MKHFSLVFLFLLFSGTACNNPKNHDDNKPNNNPVNQANLSEYVILGQTQSIETPPRSEMGKPAYRQAKEVAMVKAQKQILDWLAQEGVSIQELPLVSPKGHGLVGNDVVVCLEISAEKLQQALSEKNIVQAEAVAKKTGKGIQSWSSAPMN